MAMQGDDLKRLRNGVRLTQAEAAEALGVSGPYIGELERNEKPIDERLSMRIEDALRAQIDVAYSEGLAGWTVSLCSIWRNGPGQRPRRVHEVLAKYDTQKEAEASAEVVQALREPFARIVVHPRRHPVSTTNPSGI